MKHKILTLLFASLFIFTCIHCAPKDKPQKQDDQKIKSGVGLEEEKAYDDEKINVKATLPLPE